MPLLNLSLGGLSFYGFFNAFGAGLVFVSLCFCFHVLWQGASVPFGYFMPSLLTFNIFLTNIVYFCIIYSGQMQKDGKLPVIQ